MHIGQYVFTQIASFLPKRYFERLVVKSNDRTKGLTPSHWSQLLVLMFGQLMGCRGLRELTDIIPSRVAIENLKRICGWLEILRERYNMRYGDGGSPPELGGVRGGLNDSRSSRDQTTPDPSYSGGEIPIVISSGYRSEEVNRKCGGAKGSNHLTGCAVDIKCLGPEQMIRYACLLLDTADENGWVFDELIQEKRGTTYLIHFAVRPKENRRKILFDCR
jgi:hypothetical protein